MEKAIDKPGKNTKLFFHLKKWLEKAVMDHRMIEPGDRLLVGVSGGADSFALLDLLDSPMVFVPDFSMLAVHIDMGFDPEYMAYREIQKYLDDNRYQYVMEKTDIGLLAHSDFNRKNPCFLCSRLRRKRIFEIADRHGCNKIAFAHHRDDIIETLLINMFYGREISTMMPCQSVFGGKLHIIRPLAVLEERLIKKYRHERGLPTFKNACPSSENSRRNYVKKLLDSLEIDNPNIRHNIYTALGHVKPDYLPAKKK
ncbi:MAG TPA: ATP-binding protein [Smithellaceae bacterium]|nr:ATP-binding protein [Smithellaceae bacterium]HQF83789.1 ATP-binding protein [Smithellaceae bacterium]HQG79906.1 ATP-binding protein [Smithellaceae bacterium]